MERQIDDVVIPYYRDYSNGESDKAKAMFRQFMSGDFSYDEISNHPDYLVYASAEVLAIILPLLMDEMFVRNDHHNFLIYHIISAFDPAEERRTDGLNERFCLMKQFIDKTTIIKLCKLLSIVWDDPPVPIKRLERIKMGAGVD